MPLQAVFREHENIRAQKDIGAGLEGIVYGAESDCCWFALAEDMEHGCGRASVVTDEPDRV